MGMRLLLCLLMVVGSAWLGGCEARDGGGARQAGQAAGQPPPAPEVEMATATRKTISMQQILPGRLEAVETAMVRARVDGIVEQRLFAEGSDVKSGDKLFQLEDRTLRARVAAARATLERARADHLLARQTLDRLKPLVNTEAVSRQEYDQATAQQARSGADVKAAEAELTRVGIDLGWSTVTAPIDGRAGRAMVTVGALVGQKEATHLVTIEKLDPIRVVFSQASAEMFRLRRAKEQGSAAPIDPVEVRLVLEDDVEYPLIGRLLFTDMAVDPKTGTVEMRAEFRNPERKLLPGQFARVQIALATSEGVTIPQRAVQNTQQGQIVLMVDAKNKVVPRPVRTGGFSGQDWIILEGLKEGEKVIVNGHQKARPGSEVTPKEAAAPARAS
ncbi:MAG: efflux RND transporter periplasmic adaptor subunit [Magnetococcales bacterium]|nr:efflux RND transporter periplasmic adaptor subunit [Magnetococcales bacterium]